MMTVCVSVFVGGPAELNSSRKLPNYKKNLMNTASKHCTKTMNDKTKVVEENEKYYTAGVVW